MSDMINAPSADDLSSWLTMLAAPSPAADDGDRIERIRRFEELKAAVAAAQARETVALVDSQRAAQQAAGEPDDRVGRGVAAQVGLARRISPFQASRYSGWAKTLIGELPATYAALRAGRVSETRAFLVTRETVWLSREHREIVDAALAPQLAELSDRRLEAECHRLGYGLDPAGYVQRRRQAETDRRVGLAPAPDCMTRLTALLPVTQGVAAYAALTKAATDARAAGDERGRGQIMADTLVERVTGQTSADAVPVNLNVVMTDETLFNSGERPDEPAHVVAAGAPAMTIPAELARRAAGNPDAQVFLRRLFTRPTCGQLAAMDSRSRLFPANLRHFLLVRDRYCRTPWCGAPIRHADHATPAAEGGLTTADDGQGLCEACNYNKQAPGWIQTRDGADIVTTTPTGHRYRSKPPRPPGWRHDHRKIDFFVPLPRAA